MDSLDCIVAAVRRYVQLTGRVPELWKADVEAAFRRVPIRPEDRWAAWVTFLVDGEAVAARHNAMMFGAIGAVHGRDRLGALVKHVGRAVLRLPLFRYVDDYFSLDHQDAAQHALECFARIVRAMLGQEALAPAKMECANPLEVLGVRVKVDPDGVSLEVAKRKREEWSQQLQKSKAAGVMMAGEASKFAGRLGFAAQKWFNKLGRAMLRPFFGQQYAPLYGGRIGPMLVLAMDWWPQVLQERVGQRVPVWESDRTAQLFCDARGFPARMAAVLYADSRVWYTSWEPNEQLKCTLQARRDNQIMAWELLAIGLGVSTFAEKLKGRRVRVWCDIAGGESTLRAGAAKASDHNLIVHALWLHAARVGYGLWVERVASKDNIADLPSREAYKVLDGAGSGMGHAKGRRGFPGTSRVEKCGAGQLGSLP